MAVQGAVGEFLGRVDAEEDGGEEVGLGVVVNVARFCAELLAAGTVWIGVLKVCAAFPSASSSWRSLTSLLEPRPPHPTPTAKSLRRGPPRHPPDRARQTHRGITISPRSGL